MPELATLPTPCLLLDEPRMRANIARIHGRLAGTGVAYRAHLKTAKSVEVARRQMTGSHGPAMVSTLEEADIFAEAGVIDLTYGVGIAPDKLDQVRALGPRAELRRDPRQRRAGRGGRGGLDAGLAARGADRDRRRRAPLRGEAADAGSSAPSPPR